MVAKTPAVAKIPTLTLLVTLRLIRRHETSFSRQLCTSIRPRQVLLLTIFARRHVILRRIPRHKTSFSWQICTMSRPLVDFCTMTRHFRSNSTTLHIDTSSTRPVVDGFCTTTRHFTSNSTSQVVFFRPLCSSTRPRHILLLTIFVGQLVTLRITRRHNTSFSRQLCAATHPRQVLLLTIFARRHVTCRGCVDAQSCLEKDVLWRRIRRKVTSRPAKIVNKRTCRGHVDEQSGLKKMTWDVELEVKWRVVVQKASTKGRVENVSMRKVVELDVKWRVVVQKCQQDDDLMCKFVKKKTSRDVELDVKWRVVA